MRTRTHFIRMIVTGFGVLCWLVTAGCTLQPDRIDPALPGTDGEEVDVPQAAPPDPELLQKLHWLKDRWSQDVVPVSTNYQTFYDDAAIARTLNLERKLAKARKLNDGKPIMEADQAWELEHGYPGIGPFFSVLRDPSGDFQMWYGSGQRHQTSLEMGYAVSSDGLQWRKKGRSAFGPVAGLGVGLGKASSRTDSDYVMVYSESAGPPIRFAFSSEGGRWTKAKSLIDDGSRADTQKSVFWDPLLEAYRVSCRDPVERKGRGIRQYLSRDLKRRNAGLFRVQDSARTSLPYDAYSFNIHREGDLYIGKYSLFHRHMFACVSMSRNGVDWTWEWIAPEHNLIPRGQTGTFDGGSVWWSATPFIDMGDEQWIYYAGHPGKAHEKSKDGSVPMQFAIGVAAIRKGGLFYMQPKGVRGQLTTKPFILQGAHIHVNADASLGEVRVELLDDSGRPLPGFSSEDCRPLVGAALAQKIQWAGGQPANLVGQPVSLRFRLLGPVRLYGFQIVP